MSWISAEKVCGYGKYRECSVGIAVPCSIPIWRVLQAIEKPSQAMIGVRQYRPALFRAARLG
jgi:hypothetical protein